MLAWNIIGLQCASMRGHANVLQPSAVAFEEPNLPLTNDSEVPPVDECGSICSSVDIATLPLFPRENLGIKRLFSFCLRSHFQSKTI